MLLILEPPTYHAFQVVVFILLINLLIAIITNTYQRIVDNSDVIW